MVLSPSALEQGIFQENKHLRTLQPVGVKVL